MNRNLKTRNDQPKDDLRAALNCVRQATLSIPDEMEEIREDLKWIEESMEAALSENSEGGSFDPYELGGLGA